MQFSTLTVIKQLILSKLFLMNCARNSNRNYCRGSIHSKFTLSCIGHVIDGWELLYEKGSDHVYLSHFIETLASNKFKTQFSVFFSLYGR